MGVGKVTRVIDAASQHVQGVDMVLSRVSAIGSALADLIASRWLEPTGMAAVCNRTVPAAAEDKEASAHQNWDMGRM